MTPATSSHISEDAVERGSANQSDLVQNFEHLALAPEDSNTSTSSQHYPHYDLPYRGLPSEIRLQIWALAMPSALEATWFHIISIDPENDCASDKNEGTYVVTEPHEVTSYILNPSGASSSKFWHRDYCEFRDLETQYSPSLMTLLSVFRVNKTVRAEALEALQWVRPHLLLTDISIAQMQSLLSCLSPCASYNIFNKLTITHIHEYDTIKFKHFAKYAALKRWRQVAVRLRVNILCLKFFNRFALGCHLDVFHTMANDDLAREVAADAAALVLNGTVRELQLVFNHEDYLGEYWHPKSFPWDAEHNYALHLDGLSSDQFQRLDIRFSVDAFAFDSGCPKALEWDDGFMVLIRLKSETT